MRLARDVAEIPRNRPDDEIVAEIRESLRWDVRLYDVAPASTWRCARAG